MARQKDFLIFTKDMLLEVLLKIDQELNQEAFLYLIGGAAASIAYDSKSATRDIDLWKMEALVDEAYQRVKEKYPELELPFSSVRVKIESEDMKSRFQWILKDKFQFLRLYVPDPEDLFLLKAQRANEKDIEDLSQLKEKQNLEEKIILKRFQEDILPLNHGDDTLLVEKYLYTVASIFNEDVANEHEKLLKYK